MQEVQDVAKSVNQRLIESQGKTDLSERLTADSSSAMKAKIAKRFWFRMTELYGSAWSAQVGDEPTALWSDFLASVSPKVIGQAIALAARSGSKFPPHLPEFATLCQQVAGYPPADQAYRDAANHRWQHAVVYETARRLGLYEIRRASERDILPAWRAEYSKVCAEAMAGASFEPPAVPALTVSKRTVTDRDRNAGELALSRLKGVLQIG